MSTVEIGRYEREFRGASGRLYAPLRWVVFVDNRSVRDFAWRWRAERHAKRLREKDR